MFYVPVIKLITQIILVSMIISRLGLPNLLMSDLVFIKMICYLYLNIGETMANTGWGGVILPSKLEEANIASLRNQVNRLQNELNSKSSKIAQLENELNNKNGRLTTHTFNPTNNTKIIDYPKNSVIWITIERGGTDSVSFNINYKPVSVKITPTGKQSKTISLYSHTVTQGAENRISAYVYQSGHLIYQSAFQPIGGRLEFTKGNALGDNPSYKIDIWTY